MIHIVRSESAYYETPHSLFLEPFDVALSPSEFASTYRAPKDGERLPLIQDVDGEPTLMGWFTCYQQADGYWFAKGQVGRTVKEGFEFTTNYRTGAVTIELYAMKDGDIHRFVEGRISKRG